MFITDTRAAPLGRHLDVVGRALAAGVELAVQLREKHLGGSALLDAARRMLEAVRGSPDRARLLINARVDVALAAGAHGVHLPSRGVPPGAVRESLGARLSVGVSTHAPDEARRAADQGADYVLFGPVFATPSKAGLGEPQGLRRLEEAAAAADGIPVLAVGGVTPERAASCRGSGAWGVAVIRALLSAPDPGQAARALAGAADDEA